VVLLMPFARDRPAVAGRIVGLAIWPSNVAVTASGADVVSAFSAHQAGAVTQFALVESRSLGRVLSHGR
jgi:hypothetical protein